MRAALLVLALALAPQDPGDDGPTPAQVAEARGALDAALRSGELAALLAALEAAQRVPHAEVVKRVARALRDERKEVQLAALASLRWNAHAEALAALTQAQEERRWKDDRELLIASLRAIGQHGDPRSVALLAREPFEPHDHAVWRARIFGLARIGTEPALEALLGILGATTTGRPPERRVAPLMPEMRTALVLLTGVDLGLAPELWEDWWRANRKRYRPPEKTPLLPKELREGWDEFWGLPPFYERERRREDRGREPPPRSP
ncbi:MAG TPA: HEAT repeat domain-containing protein [Planctomycetota bacterium]